MRHHNQATGSSSSSSSSSGSKSRLSSRKKLNPAFASAHGIIQTPTTSSSRTSNHATASTSTSTTTITTTSSTKKRIEQAIQTARSTGKLNLANANLTNPLPDAIFDLRFGIQVDLSFDSSSSNSQNSSTWGCIGEEGLTLVDLSDNDLGMDLSSSSSSSSSDAEQAKEEEEEEKRKCPDERIERYKSIQTLRLRRCNLSTPQLPLTSIQTLESLTILDLAGNALSGCVPLLEYLPHNLKELNISSNQITSLTSSSSSSSSNNDTLEISLPNLTHLDVSNNHLTTLLPLSVVVTFAKLDTLRFSQNQIQEIPSFLIRNSSRSLSTVEGSQNKLIDIPLEEFASCDKLRILDLSQNLLKQVPKVHSSLVRLNLASNEIASVDGLFPQSTKGEKGGGGTTESSKVFKSDLVEFKLRQNKISTLDAQVMSSLHDVTFLDVGENELRDVPYVLGYLPKLRRIALDGNPLRVIRPSLAEDMEALKKSLRRRGNAPLGLGGSGEKDDEGDVVDVVDGGGAGGSIGGRRKRSVSTASAERKKSVNTDKAKDIVISALGGSNTLKIDNQQCTALPQSILHELLTTDTSCRNDENDSCLTFGHRIKTLSISKNLLRAVDEKWMDALPYLNTLNASHNRLEKLPNNLGCIPLSTCLLERNSLTASSIAASALCRFDVGEGKDSMLARRLVHLDLSFNEIEYIPEGLFQLPVLSTLVLSNNQISSLATPSSERAGSSNKYEYNAGWKPGLTELTHLDLSCNCINDLGDLPIILGGCCSKIQTLKLNNNELGSIPSALGLVSSLNHVDLRGNPQRAVRGAVLERSCESILLYLRNRMNDEELQNAKKKQSEVGKLVVKKVQVGSEHQRNDDSVSSSVRQNNNAMAQSKNITSGKSSRNGTAMAKQQPSNLTSPLAESLRKEIDDLTIQVNNVHLTEAKKYAMKKKLAMQKAKLIREERRIRTENK